MTDLDTLDASDFSDTEEPVVEKKITQRRNQQLDKYGRVGDKTPAELPELNKYGKPKRKMTEAQLAALAAARIKAHAKRKEIAEMKAKEKEIQSESFLIKKLELQKRIKAHEKKKKMLMKESDSESEEEKPKRRPRKTVYKDEEDIVERKQQAEIEELKKQLELLSADLQETKKEVVKPKRRVVKTIIESDLEDESGEIAPHAINETKTPTNSGRAGDKTPAEVISLSRHNSNSSIRSDISRTSVRRPIMEELPKPKPFEPVKRGEIDEQVSKRGYNQSEENFKMRLRELFPNYR